MKKLKPLDIPMPCLDFRHQLARAENTTTKMSQFHTKMKLDAFLKNMLTVFGSLVAYFKNVFKFYTSLNGNRKYAFL